MSAARPHTLDALFQPKSIAVVGVSRNPEKLGSIVLHNIIDGDYQGSLYPVNPKYPRLYDLKCYKKVSAITQAVDLVCICVPAESVVAVLEDCAKKKVQTCIIFSAGFSEVGERGTELENHIKSIAKENNITLLGPNCLGVLAASSKLNASFAASSIRQGDIAFMSQSGACCSAILDMSQATGVGFSHFVSIGNKAGVGEIDLLEKWLTDDAVKVIGAYLEEIDDGRDFVTTVRQSQTQKPCVVLKPGKSIAAQTAIASHTGSLAGSAQIIETALAQNGLIQVATLRELFQQMLCFSWCSLPLGNKVAILTNAGGPGVITTDELDNAGLQLAELSTATQAALSEVLPAAASVHNPVDIIGDARADRYRAALQVLIQDESVDAVILLLTPQLMTQITDTAKQIVTVARQTRKPILPVFIGGSHVASGMQWLFAHAIPAFSDSSDAIRCLQHMYWFQEFKRKNSSKNSQPPRLTDLKYNSQYRSEVHTTAGKDPAPISDTLAHRLCEEVRITLPKQVVVHDIEHALEFADHHYPVVLKVPSEILQHKTEHAAVMTNILNKSQLATAFGELAELVTTELNKPLSLLIQEQIQARAEVFIGVQRDGSSTVYEKNGIGFGHHLTVGHGGIYTEVYQDVAHALLPSTQKELLSALEHTKLFKILKGTRSERPLAYFKLLEMIESVQQLVLTHPKIVSIDINPVLVTKRRAVAVDVKILTQA